MTNSWAAGTVEISGGRLAYHRTGGGGAPLVLSHGLTDNGLCWSRLAAALEGEFDIVMLDARGHGDSSRVADVASLDPGRDLAEAIEGLGLKAPIVMGHSVGARATAGYAGRFPDRVLKVILEDPPLTPAPEPDVTAARRARFRRQIESMAGMSDAEIVALGKGMSPSWRDDEFPAWAASKKQVDPEAYPTFDGPWQDSIAAITAPTLLIHGDPALGSLVTPPIAAEATTLNPRLRVRRIDGAGHNVRRENFDGYLHAVRQFLASN